VAHSLSTHDAQECLVCGADRAKVLYRLSRFHVLRCSACRQVQLWPLPDHDEIRQLFTQLYTTGQGSVPELESYYTYCYDDQPSNPLVQLYEGWLDTIERHQPPGRLLDVGCGAGLFLAVARRRGWSTFGVDGSAEATRHAREYFGLEVRVGDFADFAREQRTFDVITMWDIIEHARDPLGLLTAARACLAPHGLAALSTPNQRSVLDVVAGLLYRLSGGRMVKPLEKFYIEQHFLYFTPDTLRTALERADLSLAHLERQLTDLRRLALSPLLRLGLSGLFALGRLLRLENRLFALARPATLLPAAAGIRASKGTR
jgi:2-polyprenyl-3-methyl-5-hydroxy-6-metoxy-1,4-benzoquinol methylase